MTLKDFSNKMKTLFNFRYLTLDGIGMMLSKEKPFYKNGQWKTSNGDGDIYICNLQPGLIPVKNIDLSEYMDGDFILYSKCLVEIDSPVQDSNQEKELITFEDISKLLKEIFPFRYISMDSSTIILSPLKPIWAFTGWRIPNENYDYIFISTYYENTLFRNTDFSEYEEDGKINYSKCVARV